MDIRPPNPDNEGDRTAECQFALAPAFDDLAARAVLAGWETQDIMVAMMELANAWFFSVQSDGETDAKAAIEALMPKERH